MSQSKLNYLQQKKLNPADELRHILAGLEDRQPKLKSMTEREARDLLRDLDRVYQLLGWLEEEGVDLQSEAGRFAALQGHFRKNARPILKALGGASALADYRPSPPPPRERWWWYVHEDVASQQRRILRQIAIGAIALLLVVGGLYLLFQTVLAPSPEAIARLEAESDSLIAFETGDLELALAEIRQGLAVAPADPGLLIMEGVFLQALDRPQEAEQSFARSLSNVEQPEIFYIGRGQIYLRTNQFAESEADARRALEINEESAAAWLLLGQALEFQGKRFLAIPAYEQAGELALAQGEDQLVVMARLALGRVTNSAP